MVDPEPERTDASPGDPPAPPAGDVIVATGTVRWFSPKKGYGFIVPDEGDDVFVHHSVIQMEGYRTLAEGQAVEYEARTTDKGAQAVSVRPL